MRQRSWRLVPKQAGLLLAEEHCTRAIKFEVTVVARMHKEKKQDEGERVFLETFDMVFEVRPNSGGCMGGRGGGVAREMQHDVFTRVCVLMAACHSR